MLASLISIVLLAWIIREVYEQKKILRKIEMKIGNDNNTIN